tara:strand:- start:835 stop:1737 length:903 start_codon:yes stop_codon:yes gene_type:complete
MAVGDIITAARYNNLQSRVATIMGVGSGDDGYGQNLSSSQVAVTAIVNANDMQTLYTDIANGRIHQTGAQPTEIAFIQATDVVLDSDTINKKGVAQFENLVTTLENDKFVIAPTQSSAEAVLSAQYTTSWNGTLTHVMNITFGSADLQRHFFNAGGEVRMASNITYTGTSSKTLDWMTMLVNMGTVKMGYTGTTATGSGSGSAIGYHDLTSSYQQIFIKNGTGLYAANNYKVEAKKTSGTVLTFKLTWNDDNTGNPNTDENVLGVLNSTITQLRATTPTPGTGVEVATPTYTTDGSSDLT